MQNMSHGIHPLIPTIEIIVPQNYYPRLQTKVGIMAGSSGGSPTYLAKIRDSLPMGKHQINRAIVTIGSVSDFLLPEIKEACRRYLNDDLFPQDPEDQYYLEDYNVFKHVIDPYLRGELGNTYEEALWNARKKLVRSSPIYFANYLTNIQVHHGDADNLCRVAHSEALAATLPYDNDHCEIVLYQGEDHSIGNVTNKYPSSEINFYPLWIRHWYDLIISGD